MVHLKYTKNSTVRFLPMADTEIDTNIEQKINEYFYLIKENFNNGIKEYESFREICGILHIDYKKATSKSSKTPIVNELKRRCDFSYIEHSYRIIIKEIYDTPKPKEKRTKNKKSKYAVHTYPLIINLLYSEDYNNKNFAVFDRYTLFNRLGFSNNWFYQPQNLDYLDQMVLDELRDNCWEIINQAFSRTIKYLKKDNISFSEIYKINYIENSYTLSPTFEADDEKAKLIEEKTQELYEEHNCENGHQFYKNYPYSFFKKSLNEKLKEYGIVYNATHFKISFTNPTTSIVEEYHKCFGDKSSELIIKELQEHKIFVNSQILPQIYKRNIKEAKDYFETKPLKNHVDMQRKDDIFGYIIEEFKANHPNELIDRPAIIESYITKRNNFIKHIIEIVKRA